MWSSNSTVVRTEIAVWQNTTKSLIFRAAELLIVFAVWRLFSLLAATQNRFTSFLVFSESPIQKVQFVLSRRLSPDALLVGFFTIIYAAAQLYGTLLWALDSPGHVIQTNRAAASSASANFLDNPEYMVSYTVTPSSLNLTDKELAEALSVNLFRAGTNISLTGAFDQGTPESVQAPRPGAGPRIWLDKDGWSVATATDFHTVVNLGAEDALNNQLVCPYGDVGLTRYYNCTFGNEWTPDLVAEVVGIPEVHYNQQADGAGKFGRVRAASDDIWAAIGHSSGAALRIHMFTVTQGYQRHTFVSTIAKSSIVSTEGEILESEMKDLMQRVSAPEPGQETAVDQGIAAILSTLTAAQKKGKSAAVGWLSGDENPNQLLEGFWELLSMDTSPGDTFIRVFRFTSVNITLLQSETISTPPVPFKPCTNSHQNVAFGGKVTLTDCIGSADRALPHTKYFGQVDTSAVLNLDGLDRAPFASSADALDPVLFPWVNQNIERLTNLVLSRGYALAIDPKLVTVEFTAATPGISYLQLFMVLFAGLLAAGSYVTLWFCASGHWSSSCLVNLLSIVYAQEKQDPGFLCFIK
ncbi:hypothetical protein QBC42DRAFT_339659 [Cladorrhinum samala]|uniref:Uncharacterized protein n=1 Tax=Cladorrhinum samala TaxID=585594 RepID=A0AAV9HIN2_9PEZI|nr:hypothetical protein QBC42DRAFT_339659 [Cladorrhinum samala]